MTLQFRPDDTFTIALFTDIHWRGGSEDDSRSAQMMGAVLDAEQPDLVVLNGDTIDGSYCDDPAGALQNAVAPVVARDLAWAAVFGNHDDEGALDRAALMAVMQGLPGCMAEPGPVKLSGVGNYVLTVAGEDDQPHARLYFLDSHAYAAHGHRWLRLA